MCLILHPTQQSTHDPIQKRTMSMMRWLFFNGSVLALLTCIVLFLLFQTHQGITTDNHGIHAQELLHVLNKTTLHDLLYTVRCLSFIGDSMHGPVDLGGSSSFRHYSLYNYTDTINRLSLRCYQLYYRHAHTMDY
jgi:hypothetical protein